ncbi:Radical SAM superfamily protein [Rhizobiales bacterium GAS188]|nr:Radical SAM superfamily protein [Rhizobiales bacterium GAS188]
MTMLSTTAIGAKFPGGAAMDVARIQRQIFDDGYADEFIPAVMHWLPMRPGRERLLEHVARFIPFLDAIQRYDREFGDGELKKEILQGRFAGDFVPRVLHWLQHRSGDELRKFPEFTDWFEAVRGYAKTFGETRFLARAADVLPVAYLSVENYRVNSDQMAPVETAVSKLSDQEISALFDRDPWLWNLVMSMWEYANGKTRLTTYPWNISLPIADICNARCIFCTSWLEGRELISLEQIDALDEAIRHALYLGLVGHGEPMAHPKFKEIADKLSRLIDRRATLYTITNGYFLTSMFEQLERLNIMSYSISLNAASAAVHEEVMGLGANGFEQVLGGIRKLIAYRETKNPDLRVYITMVVTAQNVHEAAEFVRLGNELGVTEIWLRSLLPQSSHVPGLNYHLLPPSAHPEFKTHQAAAIQAIAGSRVPVQADPNAWAMDVISPMLREEVRRNPPALIHREDALRDRKLRMQSAHLYKAERTALQGQRRNDAGTIVSMSGGELHIATPAAPYSFAAEIAITRQLGALEGARSPSLNIDVKVNAGIVGIGVLDSQTHQFTDRKFIAAGFDGVLTLDLPSDVEAHLIVENGDEKGGASQASIRSMTAVAQQPEGLLGGLRLRAPSQSIDLISHLKIHNPADPLDDGLNPLGRTPRLACRAVYYNLYINEMFFRVNPCCYMQNVPGYQEVRFDGSAKFMDVWNSPAFIDIRTKLRDGPLYAACRRCPEKW